ncbi:MAG TPA: DUF502 domain-containing protein [Woeseiaceae bacterium]
MPLYRNPRKRRYTPRPRHPLIRLWRTFLTGLVAIIPLAVTAYVVYWLFTAADSLFSGIGRAMLPPGWYFPGLGLVAGALAVLALGAVLNAWVFGRVMLTLGSRLLERIPLIKTVYSGVRDLMLFVSRTPDHDRRHVVLVTLPGDIRLIGFITDTAPAQVIPELNLDGETVLAVYLPMSYQIGGYALYLPERCLQRLQMSVEEGMRMVLTAGMNRPRTDSLPTQST